MNVMKKNILYILAITILISVHSQSINGQVVDIKGSVRNGQEGIPVQNAWIYVQGSSPLKETYSSSDGSYFLGGVLTGHSYTLVSVTPFGNQTKTIITMPYGNWMNFWFNPPSLPSDYDNNFYPTVSIGIQVWTAKNLVTTHFNDGTNIPYTPVAGSWSALLTPGFCWYAGDDVTNGKIYGALYNWYTVNAGNLCPVGWHVPSAEEWNTLSTLLGGQFSAGGKLKETGTTHWNYPNPATNETGFTALPGGVRDETGAFANLQSFGHWWSTNTSSVPNWAILRILNNVNIYFTLGNADRKVGTSIRCINDFLLASLTTTTPTGITRNSAQSGGNITSDNGSPITVKGVCWNTSPNPTISNTHTNDGSGTGTFTSSLSGLLASTIYYVRAYASNSAGPSYGDEISFTTCASSPIIGTITQPTCIEATGSVVLNGLPPIGTWTLNRNPDNVILTGAETSTTVTNIPSGSYTFTVTNESGCASVASSNVVINPQPSTPTAPIIGIITQPTCEVSTGSVMLNGLPSSGTWTLARSPGGVTYTGTETSFTVSGLVSGTYTFSVTNASGCTSTNTGNVIINSQPITPTVTVSNNGPICSGSSLSLTGGPNEMITYAWTGPNGFSSSLQSPTVSASATIAMAGAYTLTVTNSNGCQNTTTTTVTVNPTPAAPTVDAITQPTCTVPTGSVALSGLPAGNWTINPGNISGSTSSTTIPNLSEGTYNFIVTSAAGCTSPASANVVITPQPATPTAPLLGTITQPTCTVATGSVAFSGLPAGNWTLTESVGSRFLNGSGTESAFAGLTAGTYTFTVTNANGCISLPSANVTINAQPAIPTAPIVGVITNPTCTVTTGSVAFSGLPETGTWTLKESVGSSTVTGTGIAGSFSGLAANTYTFTVINANGCISPPSENATINAQPATPTAPLVGTITQPTCTVATGSVAFSGLPAGNWTLTESVGSRFLNGSGTESAFAGLTAGTYTFTVTNADGCISPASGNVVINSQPVTPTAPVVGTITNPTCSVATGSVALSGLPATGTWTLTRNPGGVVTIGTGTSFTITGLPAGTTYTFTVTNAEGCVSPASADVVIGLQPATPTAISSAANAVASETATLNGLVNANNTSAVVTFEYGPTPDHGSSIAATPSPVTGTDNTAVSANVEGLIPYTTYHYRIVAVSAGCTAYGDDLTFTTQADHPIGITGPATAVSSVSARLNGTVNANNASTTVSFDYGLSIMSMDQNAPAVPGVVNGNINTPVIADLTGLVPGQTYYYYIRTESSGGAMLGETLTFNTPAQA